MMKELPRARLRVTNRLAPISSWLPFFRFFLTLVLFSALLTGAVKFLSSPAGVEALEFTTRVVGSTGGQVGILDEAVSDLDGDGDMDIVTVGTGGVRIYEQTSKGKFSLRTIDDDSAYRVELADFNNDDDKDLLVSLKNNPGVRWYRNDEGLDFEGFDVVGVGTPGLADSGDIDNDGDDDIVTANNEGGIVNLRRWMNDGDGSFTPVLLQVDAKITALTVGSVNGDDYPDIVVAGTSGLQRWARSANSSSFSRIDIDSDNVNKSWIALGDVTGDGKTDIATGDQNKDFVALYKNQDNSTWQRNLLDIDADAGRVVLADFEGDDDIDLIVTSQDESTIYWLDNDAAGGFTQRTIATGLQSVLGVAVADVDKDNDLDFVAADHFRGTLFWYERVRAKPVAGPPSDIQQSSSGSGVVSFTVQVSDGDLDPTRLRIEYSVNSGQTFHKAAIVSAKVSAGSVDVNHDVGYQIGTSNAIDTQANDSVEVTLAWDSKSVQNLGGPLSGDIGTVVLRATARDNVSQGVAASSSVFRVDNRAPQGLTNFRVAEAKSDSIQLAWTHPVDSSDFTHTVFYGTDVDKVNDRTADVWRAEDDKNLNDIEATNTTITKLKLGETYSFKLVVKDVFGNETSSPTIQGTTSDSGPTPTPNPGFSDGVSPTPAPTALPGDQPSVTPAPTPPLTTFDNEPPVADAGSDQVVNPNTLVILDGTASLDGDGEALVFVWRQLSGRTLELLSSRTATPSFSAGDNNETYIFSLMVRDPKGASSTDIVTVATKSLPNSNAIPVATTGPVAQVPAVVVAPISAGQMFLRGLDLLLLLFAFVATSISGVDRLARNFKEGSTTGSSSLAEDTPKGRVVHYRTGEPIVGATVLVYSEDGKLKSSERTNPKGEFTTLFPTGSYAIVVQAPGFAFAPMTAGVMRPDSGILYTGGPLTVRDGSRPISITIPMKPAGEEIGTWQTRGLHVWQAVQRWGRMLSWPVFLVGAGLNTVLIFWVPNVMYLVVEVLYVILVVIKVALEVRVRPAYGMVRDAITHVPLDLAVVRLYEQGTNRLVMTRVTNTQGRFFALPPAGTYTVTVTKPGYGLFTKDGVLIATDQDSALQITTDLMPSVPQAGLSALRSAVL